MLREGWVQRQMEDIKSHERTLMTRPCHSPWLYRAYHEDCRRPDECECRCHAK